MRKSRSQFILSSPMTSYRALTVWQDQAAPACYRQLTAGISPSAHCLPDLVGTWILTAVLSHLTGDSRTGKVGRYLVIWGSFSWVQLVNGYQSRAPQSELGYRTPAPASSSKVVQSRPGSQSLCELGRDSKPGSSPPFSCWSPAHSNTTLTSIYPSVLPPPTFEVHHGLSCIPQTDGIIVT